MIRSEFQIECDICKQVALKIINQERKHQNQERVAQLAWEHRWGYSAKSRDWLWYCPLCVPLAEAEGVRVQLSPIEEEV